MIVSAPAKINLTLEVTGVEDNGYHTLDTVFAWLQLEDSLRLERASCTTLSILSEGVSTELVTSDGDNLVLKAHQALQRACGKQLPTEFILTKRIPAGGGLGGGSADAAAALFGLNRLFELGMNQQELLEVARPLGADVSFGLVGGMAHGTRYGDLLEPLSPLRPLLERELVLVFPGIPCPTPKIYSLWDQSQSHVSRGASRKLLAATTAEQMLALIANDLEEPAIRYHPPLKDYKVAMEQAGLEAVCVSGSGSTLFGFLTEAGDMDWVKQQLSHLGVGVTTTRLREDRRFELVS